MKRLYWLSLLAVCLFVGQAYAQIDVVDVQNSGTSAKLWGGGKVTVNFVNGGCASNSSTGAVDCTLGGDASDISATTATNPSAETQLKQLSLPAGALNVANRHVKVYFSGRYTTASAQTPTLRFRLYLCTVSGCGSGTVLTLADFTTAATTGAITNSWKLEGNIGTASTGATGTLETKFWQQVQLGTASDLTPETRLDQTNAASSAIDLTAALYLRLTVLMSTSNAGNSVVSRMGYASLATPGAGWSGSVSGGGTWGSITGTLSNQTDLQTALNGKAASNASTTVNGQACALGSSCTVADSTKVPTTTTVAGKALSGNITLAQTDLSAGNYTIGAYYIDQAEIAAPANPGAGVCREYVDSTTHVKTWKNSAGTSCGPSAGGGITNSAPNLDLMQSDGTNAVASGVKGDGTGNVTLPAGKSIGSADTGTPKITFGTNSITANQPVSAPGFTVSGSPAADGWTAQADPAITTVASLGTATNGLNKIVTDGSSATDCTVGGGSNKVWCQGNGSAWVYKLAATGAIWFSNSVFPNGWRYFNGTAIKDVLTSETAAGVFPTLNQNTSGTAANLSGTPALPNGTTATTQSAGDNSTKLATTAYVDRLASSGSFNVTFDGGGSAITVSSIGYRRAWTACTVANWSVIAVGGTITIDVVRIASGTTLPSTSIVGAGIKPNVASGNAATAAPASWTSTAIVAGDLLGFNVTAATATWAQISVQCQ